MLGLFFSLKEGRTIFISENTKKFFEKLNKIDESSSSSKNSLIRGKIEFIIFIKNTYKINI